jgi:hypothetical protein
MTKFQIAFMTAIVLMLCKVMWAPQADSPIGLAGVCAFLAAMYFTFRYGNQVKREIAQGVILLPTVKSQQQRIKALAGSLLLGMVTGSFLFLYQFIPLLGLGYALLALLPFDLFVAGIVYWVWLKRYPKG